MNSFPPFLKHWFASLVVALASVGLCSGAPASPLRYANASGVSGSLSPQEGDAMTVKGDAAKTHPFRSFVKVSSRDPRFFELSDGQPYVPIGFNLVRAPKVDEFESVLDAMASNKINYCRIWLNDLPWQIEHEAPGVYDEARVKILRRFLDMAGQRGVRVKLCLEEFR